MESYHGLGNKLATTGSRGDIVVDSSSLFQMCVKLPSDDDSLATGRYLDLLPFLAKNGYNIIIPEIVAYEVDSMTASGIDVSNFFESSKYKHKELHKMLRPFLKDAALCANSNFKTNPNISIANKTGPDAVDKFCRDMDDAAQRHANSVKPSTKSLQQLTKERIRGEIVALNKNRKENKEICSGDAAIISLISTKTRQSENTPIFVLTEDRGLREKLKKFPNVSTITTGRLVYSIVGAGLSVEAGLPANTSAFDLEKMRREALIKANVGDPTKNSLYGRNDNEYMEHVKSTPFFISLEKLAKDLRNQEPVKSDTPSGNEMDKFMKKYKNRYNGQMPANKERG